MILNYNIKKIITEIYKKKKFFSKNNSSFRTLMYHSIVKDSFNSKENMWDLSESTFNEQIKLLVKIIERFIVQIFF